jgi:hypothetical protein
MENPLKPESWGTLIPEYELIFDQLAVKYIDLFNTNTLTAKLLVTDFSKEAVLFINSEKGIECEASSKETVIPLIDFLIELLKTTTITEEEIISLWQEELYK